MNHCPIKTERSRVEMSRVWMPSMFLRLSLRLARTTRVMRVRASSTWGTFRARHASHRARSTHSTLHTQHASHTARVTHASTKKSSASGPIRVLLLGRSSLRCRAQAQCTATSRVSSDARGARGAPSRSCHRETARRPPESSERRRARGDRALLPRGAHARPNPPRALLAAVEPRPPDRRGQRPCRALARDAGAARARRTRAQPALASQRPRVRRPLPCSAPAVAARGPRCARLRSAQRAPSRAAVVRSRSLLVRAMVRRMEPQGSLRVAIRGRSGAHLAPSNRVAPSRADRTRRDAQGSVALSEIVDP